MRIGLSSSLAHTSPEEWAKNMKALGCRAVNFPLNCNCDPSLIKAYADAAKENDLVIAEVGVWNNMLERDPEKRKANLDYNIRQLILADLRGQCRGHTPRSPLGRRIPREFQPRNL